MGSMLVNWVWYLVFSARVAIFDKTRQNSKVKGLRKIGNHTTEQPCCPSAVYSQAGAAGRWNDHSWQPEALLGFRADSAS